MNQSKKITDGAMLTGIFVVLLFLSFIPFLSLITMLVMPVPFILYAYRHDWKPSLLMFAAAIVLSTIIATVFSIVTIIAACGGIMIGAAMHRGSSSYETWARGTVGFVVGLLFTFLISQLVFQIDIMHAFDQLMNESMQMTQELFESVGLAVQSAEQTELLQQQIALLKTVLPVGLVITALLYALISQWVSYRLINRIEQKKFHFPPFRELKFPPAIVWMYFFALIVTFFNPEQSGMLFVGVQNIIMLVGLLMIIQGFSFIFYYSHLKNKSKAIPVISIVLSVFLAPLVLPLIRILGIIDIGFRLRERITKDQG